MLARTKAVLVLAACAFVLTGPAVAAGKGVPTGGTCGTVAGLKCAARSDFCSYKEGECHTPDAAGVCTKKPKICPKVYLPVCGCNGRTYGNACQANTAGVSVLANGKCKPKG